MPNQAGFMVGLVTIVRQNSLTDPQVEPHSSSLQTSSHRKSCWSETVQRVGLQLTISGAHKHLQGTQDGAVEGPAQEGDGAGAGPLQGEAQPIVLVLQQDTRFFGVGKLFAERLQQR